jgi:hypothetical protein
MNGSIPRIKIGNSGRWRAWARVIAGARFSGRHGVTRRRGPLQMALLRCRRIAFWIAQRNILSQHFADGAPVLGRHQLRLALHWSSPLARILRTTRTVNTPLAFVGRMVTGERPAERAPADSSHIRTLQGEQTQTKTLLREIVDRTRRIEERVRVEKLLAARGVPSAAASAEVRELRRRSGPDWWKSEPAAQQQRPAATSAVNVDQIAETVMRQLDHRVNAWRERMGRI